MKSYFDCKQYDVTTLQQMYKYITDTDGSIKEKNVFPISVFQAIFDGLTGLRLDVALNNINYIWVIFSIDKSTTRLKVGTEQRRAGLVISYEDSTGKIITERYIGLEVDDDAWIDDDNWEECFVSFENLDFVDSLKEYLIDYIDAEIGKINDGIDTKIHDAVQEAKDYTDDKLSDISIDVDAAFSTTSENPVQNKVITTAINKINAELFPFTISVSGGGVFEKRTTQDITVRWTVKEGDDVVTPDTILVNDTPVANTSTNKVFNEVTTTTSYTVKATKDGVTVNGNTMAIFVNPSYFGAVANDFTPTEEAIKTLTKTVKNNKGYTGTISLNNQKVCYAYPKSFGMLSSIKDANNFEYISSYTRSEVTVWDETYYIYVLTEPVTIDSFKQIYS